MGFVGSIKKKMSEVVGSKDVNTESRDKTTEGEANVDNCLLENKVCDDILTRVPKSILPELIGNNKKELVLDYIERFGA